jgi:hypothetical protein
LPAYERIVAQIHGVARRRRFLPLVALATDEPLLNANNFTLAARLHFHEALSVYLLAPQAGKPTLISYHHLLAPTESRSMSGSPASVPNVLITVSGVGVSYFGLTGGVVISQALLEQAARSMGFICVATIRLPDARMATVSWRPESGTSSGLLPPAPDQSQPTSGCAPVAQRVFPPEGATDVPIGSPVYAVFNERMDPSSTAAGFTVTDDGHAVAGAVGVLGDRVPIFKPKHPLPARTRFTATITKAAMASTGGHLITSKTWTFTTR